VRKERIEKMKSITDTINETAEILSPEDFNWIIPKLMDLYKDKIHKLAYKSYSSTLSKDGIGTKLAKDAFSEIAKEEIHKVLDTFLFKTELWKEKRDINTYLIHSLNNLSLRVEKDVQAQKFYLVPVCPCCKENNKREYLIREGNSWRCLECTKKSEESKEHLHFVFSKHSRRGYKCPECNRFIPESANTVNGITCPYSNCYYIGDIKDMIKMAHPVGLSNRIVLSMNYKSEDSKSLEETLEYKNEVNADVHLEMNQRYNYEYNLLKLVMEEQLLKVKNNTTINSLLQKTLMYEAYLSILKKYPHDMIGYLVHKKSRTDFPLQSKIFQEYVSLVQESLPYYIKKGNKEIEINSLLDPKLALFEGISKYEALVRADGSIGNLTKERYVGSSLGKDYGSCFIGMILDIIDKNTGKSIKNKIKSYSFCEIKMDGVEEGLPVEVIHYRIASHYEVGPMVGLQKTRKRIINRIDLKIKKD